MEGGPVHTGGAQGNPNVPSGDEAIAQSVDPEFRTWVSLLDGDNHIRPLAEIEADVIRIAIAHYRGSVSEVARHLGIGRTTVYRKLSELGMIARPD